MRSTSARPKCDALNANEANEIVLMAREGFDTIEIRDQIREARLMRGG